MKPPNGETRMRVVYVCGPYRARGCNTIHHNIQEASAAAIKIWKLGAAALCPHMNTAYFDGLCPDKVWLEGDLEILRRCDAVWLLPNWRTSEGATMEQAAAEADGKPCFESWTELATWIAK
jgi:hypothetical protein